MKKYKGKIIVISIIILFFILNTITYKGYYYSVDYRFFREKVVFLTYNKAYNQTLLYAEHGTTIDSEPKSLKEKNKANVNVINFLNTFYIVSNEHMGPVFHIHLIGLDIGINKFSKTYNKKDPLSEGISLLFYQGTKKISEKPYSR